jgi:UPF0755 protein
LLKTLFALCVLAVLAAGGYGMWYVATPVAVGQLPLEFEIPPGSTLRSAARRLDAAGVRVRPVEFELLGRALGSAQDIKAGSYELTAAPTPIELLEKLSRGDVTQTEVKFIEGWNFRQVRTALDSHAFVRHDTAGLSGAQILAKLGAAEAHPEGLFFPDTYVFSKGASDLQILRRAYRVMQRHLAREWEARDASAPYRTPYEALIMASIVEKETGRAEERATIAGVLVNRLRTGMLLQVDPSVIYGIGERFDGNLRKTDLQTDGPYNTYMRAGLPPTPIAAPGLASLRASLRPTKTRALYYVSRGDGSSQFSRTLEEHNRAVRKYQLNGAR